MKFKEVASRISGLGVPIFGEERSPSKPDCETAGRILAFLEGCRVLYVPSELEIPFDSARSVLAIDEFISEELKCRNDDASLTHNLRAMRATCRKFFHQAGPLDNPVLRHALIECSFEGWELNQALGELRGVFGIYIAVLAANHGLDVQERIAWIIPPKDRSGKFRRTRRSTVGGVPTRCGAPQKP